MAQILDLVDGLVFDDLGSERACPLHALLVFPNQAMEEDFSPRHGDIEAVLSELIAVNGVGSNAPVLADLLRSLSTLQLWIGREGVQRSVWLIGATEDGGRVGVKTSVVWT